MEIILLRYLESKFKNNQRNCFNIHCVKIEKILRFALLFVGKNK